jgi:hypothetical protein
MSNKSKGPFDLIRLWGHIRNTEYYEEYGLLEIAVDGKVEVTPEILYGMEKSGFILQGVSNSIGMEYVHAHELLKDAVDVKCEHDVPMFVYTTFTFKDCRVPELEDGDKNDEQILKEIKPQQTEDGLAQESACTDCGISPNHHQGDDMNQ